MHTRNIATISLLGMASTMSAAAVKPVKPAEKTSNGFRLVVSLLDKSYDFKPQSIQFQEVIGIHTGAGLGVLAIENKQGYIWYQNGTSEAVNAGQGTTITELGSPDIPAGVQLVGGDNGLSSTTNNIGEGSVGVQLSPQSEALSFLTAQALSNNWLACNSSLAYYLGAHFVTINQTSNDVCNSNNIPEGCAPIRLYPECNTLPTDPSGSDSREDVQESRCYADVSSINWDAFNPKC